MTCICAFQIFGYFLFFSSIYSDYVQPEAVCLGQDAVVKWDLSLNSDISYVYIKYDGSLIVVIDMPDSVQIEKPFKKLIQINVTETWVVEMTMYNVTYETNGTYKCTIGFIGKPEIIIKKEILIIDPEINIFLNATDCGCMNVKCTTEYNVTLIGPNGMKTEENKCLSEDDNGNYSCCLSGKLTCPSKCKSIDVRIEDNANNDHSGNVQNTTIEISTSTQVDQLNTTDIIIICCCTILPILIVVCILLVLVHFRKKLGDNDRKNTVKEPGRNENESFLKTKNIPP